MGTLLVAAFFHFSTSPGLATICTRLVSFLGLVFKGSSFKCFPDKRDHTVELYDTQALGLFCSRIELSLAKVSETEILLDLAKPYT